ncbi:MliC family protein [Thioclava sp. GXIMD4216]|uniref:MliC family protein n=1 Tax=Thioclava litoralis TaxID=3076557 RepID=A0ABZ1DYC9_9RHOB|nr:MliC family protein [Thioclava sp. FTW29]
MTVQAAVVRGGKGVAACAAFGLLAVAAKAEDLPQPVRYHCDRQSEISAVYVNTVAPPLVVLWAEGHQVVLPSGPTGSGARYALERGYVWHTKGSEAFLAWQDDRGERVLSQCKAQRE